MNSQYWPILLKMQSQKPYFLAKNRDSQSRLILPKKQSLAFSAKIRNFQIRPILPKEQSLWPNFLFKRCNFEMGTVETADLKAIGRQDNQVETLVLILFDVKDNFLRPFVILANK